MAATDCAHPFRPGSRLCDGTERDDLPWRMLRSSVPGWRCIPSAVPARCPRRPAAAAASSAARRDGSLGNRSSSPFQPLSKGPRDSNLGPTDDAFWPSSRSLALVRDVRCACRPTRASSPLRSASTTPSWTGGSCIPTSARTHTSTPRSRSTRGAAGPSTAARTRPAPARTSSLAALRMAVDRAEQPVEEQLAGRATRLALTEAWLWLRAATDDRSA
jgi:hypothetical protein